jgi:hypothetical protein
MAGKTEKMLVQLPGVVEWGQQGFRMRSSATWSTAPYLASTACMISMVWTVLKPLGGGAIVPAKVGPRLRMSAALNFSRALCQVSCRSLAYLATLICALVMPPVMAMCVGRTGRAAMVSVPPGEVDRLGEYKFQAVSSKMSVRSPVGFTSVAASDAASPTWTFQEKYVSSGSSSKLSSMLHKSVEVSKLVIVVVLAKN